MTILITGGTGYIGKNLLKKFISFQSKVYILSRKKNKFNQKKKIIFLKGSIEKPPKKLLNNKFETLIHLAWDNLDNYNSKEHLRNLKFHKKFLKKMINNGLKKIIVTGTCAEYGLKNGLLYEKNKVKPISNYAKSKDDLRKYINKLIINKKIIFNWIRVFYLYDGNEPKKTIIGLLKHAILNKKKYFKMSLGQQTKDYVSVFVLIKLIILLIKKNIKYKIINCCSGKPTKIIDLVKKYAKKKRIKIIKGYYPVPKNEPFYFYGSKLILDKIFQKN